MALAQDISECRSSTSAAVPSVPHVLLHLNNVLLSSERRTSKVWEPAKKATLFRISQAHWAEI